MPDIFALIACTLAGVSIGIQIGLHVADKYAALLDKWQNEQRQ